MHTHSHNILIEYLLAQMTQSPPHPSSHSSDFSNANQDTPNTGTHMGQLPWPHPAHMHHPGYAPAPSPFPYGLPPPYAHAGVVHHAPQAGQHGHFPPAMTATHVGPPLTTAPFPPQHPSAPPMYHQPFPPGHFPGVTTSYATHTSYHPYSQDHNLNQNEMGSDKIEDDPFFHPVVETRASHGLI
ncbi:hypothetical protein C8R48DRAFT_779943 [Suillus tomentosus]|nr:hypothetical protein C8R48DRAFT_779943 [Suillus tomentosus]